MSRKQGHRRYRKPYGPGKASLRYLEAPAKSLPKLAKSSAGEILRCARCGLFPVEVSCVAPNFEVKHLFQCPICPPLVLQKWAGTREEACAIWNQRQALTSNPRPGSNGLNRAKGKRL